MQRLDAQEPGFVAAFAALVDDRRETDAGVATDVAAIIADVRAAWLRRGRRPTHGASTAMTST